MKNGDKIRGYWVGDKLHGNVMKQTKDGCIE
jgi:hypothetical protein